MGAAGRQGEEAMVDTIVGAGTRLHGQLDLAGMLRVDGDFRGVVRTGGRVLIAATGRAECTVHAGTVIVAGALRGDIVATERVELRASAVVVGTIRTPRLIIEEGVLFSGRCDAGGAVRAPLVVPVAHQVAAGEARPASAYVPRSA